MRTNGGKVRTFMFWIREPAPMGTSEPVAVSLTSNWYVMELGGMAPWHVEPEAVAVAVHELGVGLEPVPLRKNTVAPLGMVRETDAPVIDAGLMTTVSEAMLLTRPKLSVICTVKVYVPALSVLAGMVTSLSVFELTMATAGLEVQRYVEGFFSGTLAVNVTAAHGSVVDGVALSVAIGLPVGVSQLSPIPGT